MEQTKSVRKKAKGFQMEDVKDAMICATLVECDCPVESPAVRQRVFVFVVVLEACVCFCSCQQSKMTGRSGGL